LLFLFDLAPKRVCTATTVANYAVSSYLTFSPLPKVGGVFSVALSQTYAYQELPGFIFQWSPDFPLDCSSDHRTI